MAESYEPKYLIPSEISNKANCLSKSGGTARSANITFSSNGVALVIGRYSWDSSKLSMSILYHGNVDEVVVKNYGEEQLTATCSGRVVTINFTGDWAYVAVISSVEIS